MKDLKTIKEVLSGHAQGFSLEKIHKITGVPKTTVKRIIDRCIATGQTAEAIVQMPDETSEKLIMPSRRASMN